MLGLGQVCDLLLCQLCSTLISHYPHFLTFLNDVTRSHLVTWNFSLFNVFLEECEKGSRRTGRKGREKWGKKKGRKTGERILRE